MLNTKDPAPISKFYQPSALGNILWHELELCYGFVRRDLGTGLLPVPGFTLASLLYRKASAEEIYSVIPFANQIDGVNEDKVNKPDRPIASGATTLRAAKIRWTILTLLYLGYSFYLGVEKPTLLWIATTIAHNFLGFANFGPTKDGCMGAGCIAQLTAGWAIGGSSPEMGWDWIKYITLYMLWPIPLQDLRDVPGDKAVGRLTTPILMGDTISRIYISAGICVSQYLLVRYRILEYRYDISTIILSALLAVMSLAVVVRLFAWRTVTADRYSYWLYTVIYVFQPISACIVFA
uniref:Digeranylgeranylglyceryl phosphate synthase n=1 Tax=Talaromyces marneffei PM1 TaxID=1077442 RepID=A0A093UXV2_TALMA